MTIRRNTDLEIRIPQFRFRCFVIQILQPWGQLFVEVVRVVHVYLIWIGYRISQRIVAVTHLISN